MNAMKFINLLHSVLKKSKNGAINPPETFGELKQDKLYKSAADVSVYLDGEGPVDEMYYPEELDNCLVVGIGYSSSELCIDLISRAKIVAEG